MNRNCLLAPVALLACTLSACTSTAPVWESRMGDTNRQLNAQQLIDPAAPKRNAQTQAASDGRTVREANGRYVESFQNPPPTTIINIGGAAR
jgi:hypothetical protein